MARRLTCLRVRGPYCDSLVVRTTLMTDGLFFFFQAEDGIRDVAVTGVQTCALPISEEQPLSGFSAQSSETERQWEEKLRAIPSPENLRAYMQRLSARPHHVGSPYDQDNAEWILGKFKEFGLDAHIEQFAVLFPTPKHRLVELVDGGLKFTAKLEEPAVPEDPTSHQQSEQLPTYNAYSIDGDVTAPLVYEIGRAHV